MAFHLLSSFINLAITFFLNKGKKKKSKLFFIKKKKTLTGADIATHNATTSS